MIWCPGDYLTSRQQDSISLHRYDHFVLDRAGRRACGVARCRTLALARPTAVVHLNREASLTISAVPSQRLRSGRAFNNAFARFVTASSVSSSRIRFLVAVSSGDSLV